SNDTLVLLRRHTGRRPLYSGLERTLPEALDSSDERLIRAFKQRYERLVAASARISLERLCELVVSEHDYDLAVLARWDGQRRYANLRKLMRLARSYEELRGRETPIRWILGRLDCEAELDESGEQFELERDEATFLVRVDRNAETEAVMEDEGSDLDALTREEGQLALFDQLPTAPAVRGYRLPELAPLPQPPLHRVRRLSYSALALFERCSYRYYAERIAGLRQERGSVPGAVGLAATEIGDAVHRLLEVTDLAAPTVPDVGDVPCWYPAVRAEE